MRISLYAKQPQILAAVTASAPCSQPCRILYFALGAIPYSAAGLSRREEAPQTPPHRLDDASGRKGRHASSPHQIHQFNIIRQFYRLHWSATTRLHHPCSVVLISRVVRFAPGNEALQNERSWPHADTCLTWPARARTIADKVRDNGCVGDYSVRVLYHVIVQGHLVGWADGLIRSPYLLLQSGKDGGHCTTRRERDRARARATWRVTMHDTILWVACRAMEGGAVTNNTSKRVLGAN